MNINNTFGVILVILGCCFGWWLGDKINHQCKMTVSIPISQSYVVAFAPSYGGIDPLTVIVQALKGATNSILMQCYGFTSQPIAQALVAAKQRGVNVQIIADPSGEGSCLNYCQTNGIICLLDKTHKIAHNKLLIIDNLLVINGSYNFTSSAESHNAENILLTPNGLLANQYTSNWFLHAKHSIVNGTAISKERRRK